MFNGFYASLLSLSNFTIPFAFYVPCRSHRINLRAHLLQQKNIPCNDTIHQYHSLEVNNRHKETLVQLFKNPVPASIKWAEIEALLNALGAEISEGSGSRVRISLNGVRAVFHRPHPLPTTDKGAVKSMRRFLTEGGIQP